MKWPTLYILDNNDSHNHLLFNNQNYIIYTYNVIHTYFHKFMYEWRFVSCYKVTYSSYIYMYTPYVMYLLFVLCKYMHNIHCTKIKYTYISITISNDISCVFIYLTPAPSRDKALLPNTVCMYIYQLATSTMLLPNLQLSKTICTLILGTKFNYNYDILIDSVLFIYFQVLINASYRRYVSNIV